MYIWMKFHFLAIMEYMGIGHAFLPEVVIQWDEIYKAILSGIEHRQQDCDPGQKRNTCEVNSYRQPGFLCGNRYQVIEQAGGAPAEDGKHASVRRQRLEFWGCLSSWNWQSRGPVKGSCAGRVPEFYLWGSFWLLKESRAVNSQDKTATGLSGNIHYGDKTEQRHQPSLTLKNLGVPAKKSEDSLGECLTIQVRLQKSHAFPREDHATE